MRRKTKWICYTILCMCLTISGCSGKSQETEKKDTSRSKKKVEVIKEKEPLEEEKDYQSYFEGIDGGCVIYSSQTKKYDVYNKEFCKEQVSPCSTFKIISSLAAVKENIIRSGETTMGYNGQNYATEEWNTDISFTEAFRTSCVWYFRKVIDQIGPERMQMYLNQLQFGNQDIQEWEGNERNAVTELNGFWLESSLKISAREWVEVLRIIFEEKKVFSQNERDFVLEVMNRGEEGNRTIYGKTGTGTSLEKGCTDAWFTGMTNDGLYFSIRLEAPPERGITGKTAENILRSILEGAY